MAEGWREFLSAWEDWHLEVEEDVRELEDGRVLALFRLGARGKTSGLEVRDAYGEASLLTERMMEGSRVIVSPEEECSLGRIPTAGRRPPVNERPLSQCAKGSCRKRSLPRPRRLLIGDERIAGDDRIARCDALGQNAGSLALTPVNCLQT
jgi:hypothetical protein